MSKFEITTMDNHGEVVSVRTATTPAGVRRSLIAAIDRCDDVDSVSRQFAEIDATNWDGKENLRIRLTDVIRNNETSWIIILDAT